MKKFLLDTGIAGDYINHRLGVFERAREEVVRGNRVGIGMPVLGELSFLASKAVRPATGMNNNSVECYPA